jgi:hypothetical protein
MEQEYNEPYKSNYTIGIIFTIATLLSIAGNVISIFNQMGGCLAGIGGLISAVLLFVWFYRSHKNLRSFNTMGLKYSPGWAVGAWFIPILNLFRPYQITQEIWKASDPEASTVGWKQSKASLVVIFWWLSVLTYYIINAATIGYAFSVGIQSGLNGTTVDPTQLSSVSIPLIIGLVIYSLLTISMVNLVNDRQDEKAEGLKLL